MVAGPAGGPDAPAAVVCDADDRSAGRLARLLSRAGLTVSTCATASACAATVADERPALVVVALLLPDLDGLTLVRQLRAGYADLRIVMISHLQAETRALEAGADAFLRQPVPARRLLDVVRGLLETAR